MTKQLDKQQRLELHKKRCADGSKNRKLSKHTHSFKYKLNKKLFDSVTSDNLAAMRQFIRDLKTSNVYVEIQKPKRFLVRRRKGNSLQERHAYSLRYYTREEA
jgi:hypothetical protein